MRNLLARGLALLLMAALAYIAAGGLMSAIAGTPPVRGQLIDIGGRRIHIVCQGPQDAAGPLVVMEAGAFGFSADWASIQDKLAEQGVRSCAYDRAGLGASDPGPAPRDSRAIVSDLHLALERAGLKGPYILAGHSMAGLHVRLFAATYPDEVAGLVLLDAATPEASQDARVAGFVTQFGRFSRFAAGAAGMGLLKPLTATGMADQIGLSGPAKAEKQRAFGSAKHNRTSSDEVQLWQADAAQARAAGDVDPAIPVAVVTAGPARGGREGWKAVQAGPARRSAHGFVENVDAASHASLLGPLHNDAVIRGVLFVRGHGTR